MGQGEIDVVSASIPFLTNFVEVLDQVWFYPNSIRREKRCCGNQTCVRKHQGSLDLNSKLIEKGWALQKK